MTRLIVAVRWVCVLPGAVAGAWLGYFLYYFLNKVTLIGAGIEGSFLEKVFLEGGSGLIMGAAFVEIGRRIAPEKQDTVALALAGIGLVLCGVMLGPAILQPNYWAVYQGVAVIAGLGGMAYDIHRRAVESSGN